MIMTYANEWNLRICRPAFQDLQRILPRYYARSETIRQMLKLRWWNPDEKCVLDLNWNRIRDTNLCELIVDDGYGIVSDLRIVFYEFSPPNTADRAIWILGALAGEDTFDETTKEIYIGRSLIVNQRATDGGIE